MCTICKFLEHSKDKLIAHVKEVHCNENSELSEHSKNHSDFETNEESINSSNESEPDTKQRYSSQNKKRSNLCTSKSSIICIVQKILLQ